MVTLITFLNGKPEKGGSTKENPRRSQGFCPMLGALGGSKSGPTCYGYYLNPPKVLKIEALKPIITDGRPSHRASALPYLSVLGAWRYSSHFDNAAAILTFVSVL